MTDLLPSAPIPLATQIACVEQEIAMRRSVYPQWISDKKMTRAKAEAEIAMMFAVLATLRKVQRRERIDQVFDGTFK